MMDFKTLRQNLEQGIYHSVREVLDDIQLIWDNCKLYNTDFSKIHKISTILECKVQKEVQKLFGPIEYGKNNPSYFELENQKNCFFYEEEINFSEKIEFSQIVKQLSPQDLTKIVDLIKSICPKAF